jgi:hypothetical protein
MMEMHQHEMEGMKADIEKMKFSLAQIKANVPQIRDSAEKARWQSNVDLWEVMLAHMQKMLGHMESTSSGLGNMGHGTMHDPSMGVVPPSSPPPQRNRSKCKWLGWGYISQTSKVPS